jgi:hypothetical protein
VKFGKLLINNNALIQQEERIFLMKTKRYKIYGCLLLIFTTGTLISICSSYANNQKPLSFNEMSSVYGGCQWYYGNNGQGCRGYDISQCKLWCCAYVKGSCRQEQHKCVQVEYGYQHCTNIEVPCYGTYKWSPCVLISIPQCWCQPMHELGWYEDCADDEEGTKTGAVCWPI